MQGPRSGKILKGFTLIELAVVLVIIALLAGGSIAMILAALNREGYSRTNDKMDVIQRTMLNYAKANGFLPCPADITQAPSNTATYGVGTGSGSPGPNCPAATFTDTANLTTVAGLLPVKTLGLDDSFALDGFGRPMLYVVDNRLTIAPATTLFPLGSNVGSIIVKDDAGGTRTSAAVYALVSLGSDGHGAFSANGGTLRRNVHATNANTLQNCHCNTNANPTTFDSTLVQKKETGDQTQTSASVFDHTVRFAQLWDFSGSGTVMGFSGSSGGGYSGSSASSSSGGGTIPNCLTTGDLCAHFSNPPGACSSCTAYSFPLPYMGPSGGKQMWGNNSTSDTQCSAATGTSQATCTTNGGTWNAGSGTCSWPNAFTLSCSGTNSWGLQPATTMANTAGCNGAGSPYTPTSGSTSPFNLVFSFGSCNLCGAYSTESPITMVVTQGSCSCPPGGSNPLPDGSPCTGPGQCFGMCVSNVCSSPDTAPWPKANGGMCPAVCSSGGPCTLYEPAYCQSGWCYNPGSCQNFGSCIAAPSSSGSSGGSGSGSGGSASGSSGSSSSGGDCSQFADCYLIHQSGMTDGTCPGAGAADCTALPHDIYLSRMSSSPPPWMTCMWGTSEPICPPGGTGTGNVPVYLTYGGVGGANTWTLDFDTGDGRWQQTSWDGWTGAPETFGPGTPPGSNGNCVVPNSVTVSPAPGACGGSCTSCVANGATCLGDGWCCPGLVCQSGTCQPCAGPPYAGHCGCTNDSQCSPGTCGTGVCPGTGTCQPPSGGSSGGGGSSSGGGCSVQTGCCGDPLPCQMCETFSSPGCPLLDGTAITLTYNQGFSSWNAYNVPMSTPGFFMTASFACEGSVCEIYPAMIACSDFPSGAEIYPDHPAADTSTCTPFSAQSGIWQIHSPGGCGCDGVAGNTMTVTPGACSR